MKPQTRILSGDLCIVNQILPHRHPWAWECYLTGMKNHWDPSKVPMSKDVEQWRSRTALTDDERLVVKRCLGFFAGSESLVANNLLLTVHRYCSDAECRQYILRQAFEEALHNHTVVHVCSSLGLEIAEVYEAYQNIPAIKAKDDFLMGITTDLNRPDFAARMNSSVASVARASRQEFLRNLVTYYVICEGMLFYAGFAMLLSFKRFNKLPGICEQIAYTLRDECVSEDTEFLTRRGWVFAPDLLPTDEVAQVHDDLTMDFVRPLARSVSVVSHTHRFFNGQNHLNLMVSPNHRMVKITKAGRLITEPAEKAAYHPYSHHPLAAAKRGGSLLRLTPEERFRIAFQADGATPGKYRNGRLCGYVRCRLFLKKARKHQRLREILRDCGYQYRETPHRRGITFYVDAPPHTVDKKLSWFDPAEVTAQWCKEFIEELSYWDGHRVTSHRVTWGCVDKENVDVVQMVAAMCGYRTHYSVRPDDRSETFSDYHRLQILKNKGALRGGCIRHETLHEPAKVYGVEVPTGMVLVRRNGAVAVTGNCVHVDFGVKLINTIVREEPGLWTEEFGEKTIEHIYRAIDLEVAYAKDVLPRGVLGLSSDLFLEYMRFIANERAASLDLPVLFKGARHPFPWMAEVIELRKQKNFFETTVNEYQQGNFEDDL